MRSGRLGGDQHSRHGTAEFVKAMELARTIENAVPHQRVIFTVHERKPLGRSVAELPAIAEGLRQHDIQLDPLLPSAATVYRILVKDEPDS